VTDDDEKLFDRIRKALLLIPQATLEQIAYHVECMAEDQRRMHEDKVAHYLRAEVVTARYAKALAIIRWLAASERASRLAVKAARKLLDYDLRDLRDKAADSRIWLANMEAHKALASVPAMGRVRR